jgi:proline iminopeptidase
LLVLHGGPGADHDYLLPQMLELADDHELVFYDQRGGGRSRIDGRTHVTWRTHVDDLVHVADELIGDAPSIVGYSWGGLLALLHLVETSRGAGIAPARLVLIDPAPATRQYRTRFEDEFARRQRDPRVVAARAELANSGLRERDPDRYRQRAFELSVAGYFADPMAAHQLTPFRVIARVQQSVWESLGAYDVIAALRTVDARPPALVVHGAEDPIPLESSREVARALDASLVVIDRSGHVPYVEQPAALFASVRPFLDATAHLVRG